MRIRHHHAAVARAGFTLAEAAVTIAIVAIVLTVMLQGLQGAKFSAAHNRARKTAYELGTEMMGLISAGLWQDEIESGLTGSFAEQDEPDFFWEVALGEDALAEASDDGSERPFDNFQARRDWDESQEDESEEDEENTEPFEKIKLRVNYPKFSDFPDELVLERWIRWEQVYGPSEEDLLEQEQEQAAQGNQGGPQGAAGMGGDR
ncbi:MAG: prepilin-type N-terminal cleavage/methylation domain-containing protein [Planctomycetota bacterium]|nr:prepilin-type N-terminal cleavage/methylation domain-containing protein [Planctomycetota bacterium]MDG1984634.1 prepilin-type N-terminal cleavage/methylation domain-containing protein [Planctomycetota bacterium]